MPTALKLTTAAAATAAACYFYWRNHQRIRRTKSCMRAIRLFPPAGAPERPFPLVFIGGTCQKADVWRVRMEMLRAAGYECHALDFVQTGRYVTTYAEQMAELRKYITEKLDDERPILIGHSQGGTKVQTYLLAEGGDAAVAPEHSVRAAVLMASSGAWLFETTPAIFGSMLRTSGVARTLCAALAGMLYLEPTAFLFGGGPWRHTLGMRGLFNPETARTTLTSADGHTNARVAAADFDGSLLIKDWVDTYVCDHDPAVLDQGRLRQARAPARALAQRGCELLHLVGSEDVLIPPATSAAVAALWGVGATVVEGQGHQMGDAGWEQSVMGPLRRFLDGLE